MLRRSLYFSIIILLLSACSLSNDRKREAPEPKATYPAFSFNELSFGESGGVTGHGQSFMLNDRGILYRLDQNEKIRLDSLGHEKFGQIDAKVRDLRLLEEINQGAGNVNYYLRIKGTDFEKSFKWKKPGQEVPRLLEDLHAELIQLTSE